MLAGCPRLIVPIKCTHNAKRPIVESETARRAVRPYGGIRIADNVIVHKESNENMTRAPGIGLLNSAVLKHKNKCHSSDKRNITINQININRRRYFKCIIDWIFIGYGKTQEVFVFSIVASNTLLTGTKS